MSPEETRAFKLLDKFARLQHRCFLAEFFPDEQRAEYVLCFRPAEDKKNDKDRYACKYVRIAAGEVESMARAKVLSTELVEYLDAELELLGQARRLTTEN